MSTALQRYQQGGALEHVTGNGAVGVDVVAQHAAADSLIGRLLSMPPARYRDQASIQLRLRQEALHAGDNFFYAWDVKVKGGKQTEEISGPSIGLAEAVANAVGNCGYTTTHIETPEAWVITAFFVDRETGMVHSRQFRQRRNQRTFSKKKIDQEQLDRQEDIAFQIGQSKAIRNVIVRALRPYVEMALVEARKVLGERVEKDLDKYKARIVEHLAELKVPVKRVAHWVGYGPERWGPPEVVKVLGALQAISEELLAVDQVWPDPELANGPPPAPPRRDDRDEPPPADTVPDGPPGPEAKPEGQGEIPL